MVKAYLIIDLADKIASSRRQICVVHGCASLRGKPRVGSAFRVLETTAAKFVNTGQHIRTNYHNAPQGKDSTVVDPDQSFADTVFPNPLQGVFPVEHGIKDSLAFPTRKISLDESLY